MTFELKPFEEYAKEAGVTVTKTLEKPDVKSELIPMLKKQFLKFYRQCGLLEEAAISCGITTATVLDWRIEDEEFKKQYDDSKDNVVTLLEDALMKRALSGKSDLALMFMLKANNPEKYDDKARNPPQAPSISVQITDVGGTKLVDTAKPLPMLVEGELVNEKATGST
jgi:hypothetical protein